MITEDYCSFEIAKLLKEKGFKNEYCDNMLLAKDGDVINKYATFRNKDDAFYATMKFKKQIPYVTHQMALKWLREVHKLHIFAKPYWPQGDMRNKMSWQGFVVDLNTINGDSQCYAASPEEAIEDRVRFVLENLI